jgi:hypothetical protein
MSGGIVHDLVGKEDLRRLVGEGFSESRWDSIAAGRDKVPRSEIMNTVQASILEGQKGNNKQTNHPNKDIEKGSKRSEAVMSFLMCCDRGYACTYFCI